jgi:hypothetical protein
MRKDEMTIMQKMDRDNFLNALKSVGWQATSHFNEDFDNGWWVPYQAVLELRGPRINLSANYISGKNGQIIVNYSTKKDASTLSFHFNEDSQEIINYLSEEKTQLSENNIKDHFIELITRFPVGVEIAINDNFKPLSEKIINQIIGKGLLSSK